MSENIQSAEECPPEIMELLAEIEHDRWSGQAETALNKMTPERRERWGRLSKTKYADLDATNKELDRMQVREYWPVIGKYIESFAAAQRQAGREEADDRAFKMLEAFGVPRRRAETVENGIMVLQDRMRKAIESEQMASESLSKRYAALVEAARLAIIVLDGLDGFANNISISSVRASIRNTLSDLDNGRKG